MTYIPEKLKIKKDKEAKQLWVSVKPSAVLCKTCKFAYPNTEYTKGYEKANCQVFESPEDKPMEVLWDGADCDFYVRKE
jgi:hypothetical protein